MLFKSKKYYICTLPDIDFQEEITDNLDLPPGYGLCISLGGMKAFYKDSMVHSEKGPAYIIGKYGFKFYYLNGQSCNSIQEWKDKLKNVISN